MKHTFKAAAYLSAWAIFFIAFISSAATDSTALKLKKLTGKDRVKVVYASCAVGHGSDFPPQDFYRDEILEGFDTDRGIQDTLQSTRSNYMNPLITHDGKRIVYSRIEAASSATDSVFTYVAAWGKDSASRKVGKGFTACLWYDSASKKEYAVYTTRADGGSIRKIDLDNPPADSLMYTPGAGLVPLWLRISADGNYFAGLFGQFGSAPYEVITRKGSAQVVNSEGCWPSMPYDNSLRLVKTIADHDRWEVKAPGDDIGVQPSDNGSIALIGGQFSELRMATYCTDIFLLVTGSGDNGTGAIRIIKTDSTLVKCTGAFTMPLSGNNKCHHPDVWVGASSPTAARQNPRQNTMTPFKTGAGLSTTDLYTASCRKVAARIGRDKKLAGLPAGIYVSVNRGNSAPAGVLVNQ